MNVAGDGERERANARAADRILRQEGGLGVRFI